MQTPPLLTDHTALQRNRRRGAVTFLHAAVATEIKERLAEVNRTFTQVAIVTGFPEFWRALWPKATIVPDTDRLDLAPGAHDLVIHALALHWANDPVGQLVQCRHALRPDGLLLAALFGGQTLHELRSALAEAEAQITGGLSPRVAPMGEIRDLGALLQRAGLALPVADALPLTVSYAGLTDLMHDLRGMGEGNALAARLRRPSRAQVFARAEAIYRTAFGTADGRIPATFELVTLTGWAPAADQQQPLRPGSATHRLADALHPQGNPDMRKGD
jgi:SAM-dependent methyltransferase